MKFLSFSYQSALPLANKTNIKEARIKFQLVPSNSVISKVLNWSETMIHKPRR